MGSLRWRGCAGPALAVAALIGICGAPAPADAQDKWPSRRVTLVVPFGAGSVTDAMGRLIADQLKDAFGQPFIVENRGGAGGILGASAVWKAAPDGYTLLMGGNTTHSAAQSLYKNVPYDPVKDFTPIARIGRYPSVFATNTMQPYKTMAEFVTFAKANPGKITCGHGNATGHITCETIKKKIGIDMARLPYASTAPAMTDLLGNNMQVMVPDFLTGLPQIEAGKVVPLAVVMKERSPRLPTTPTLHETFIKNFEVSPWTSLFGPAGLPPEIVTQLSDAVGKILKDPEIKKKIDGMGTELWYMPAAEFAKFVQADIPVWAEHAKIAGIQPQ